MASRLILPSGSLWAAVTERTRHALSGGVLAPIETEQERIDDSGVRFIARKVSSLARKAEQKSQRDRNPTSSNRDNETFPFEPDLFVAEVSDTHVALLNKFPVIPLHVLIVTRTFVSQEALLGAADFAALVACMREYDALGFYNGGTEAGASQKHKHLQLVPLPLARDREVPMETLFETLPRQAGVLEVPGLPFLHAFSWFDIGSVRAEEELLATYHALLRAIHVNAEMVDGIEHQSAPYNLLVTRRWMLAVRRSHERFERISINALGYAGSIFVKNDAELERVKDVHPMAVLASVGAAPGEQANA